MYWCWEREMEQWGQSLMTSTPRMNLVSPKSRSLNRLESSSTVRSSASLLLEARVMSSIIRFLISYHHLPIRADSSPHSQHLLPVPSKVYCRLLGWYTTARGIHHVPKEETIRPTPGKVVSAERPIPRVFPRFQPYGSPSIEAPFTGGLASLR